MVNLTLPRVNRIASLIILPMMTLAIVVFARFADDGASGAPQPSSGTVVVANLRAETLTFFALAGGETRVLSVPGPPHEMVEAGGRLYVTLGRANAVVEVDVAAAAILRVLPLEGEPHGIALYGGNIVVTLDKANRAVVIDRATFTELRRYPTGDTPHVVAISSDGIFVTDSRDNMLRLLEPETRTLTTGGQPEGVALVGDRVVTADAASGSLTLATSDLSEARTIAVGAGPVRVAAFDTDTALVALQGADELVAFDVARGKVEHRLGPVQRPDGICVSPDSAYIGVTSNGDGTLQFFATKDWKPVHSVAFVAGLGACLWLPD